MRSSHTFFLALVVNSALATGLYSNSFGVPGVNASYDYVVIGGGTAGLTIAARLAEDSDVSVAVIEAGGFYQQDSGNGRLYPDAKKNGFYTVTSTYNTHRCATVAYSDPNKNVVLGFKVDVAGLGELAPSSEWYLAKQSEGINYFKAEEGSEKTVFFGSILFEARSIRVPGHELRTVRYRQKRRLTKVAAPMPFQLFDAVSNGRMEIEWTSIGDPEVDKSESEPELDNV